MLIFPPDVKAAATASLKRKKRANLWKTSSVK